MLNADIDIQVHPGTTYAGLVKGMDRWFLAFTGPPGFMMEMQIITANELGDVLDYDYSDADVIAYFESRMGVAGYIATRQPSHFHAASWALT